VEENQKSCLFFFAELVAQTWMHFLELRRRSSFEETNIGVERKPS
jgi:hypothetical protein